MCEHATSIEIMLQEKSKIAYLIQNSTVQVAYESNEPELLPAFTAHCQTCGLLLVCPAYNVAPGWAKTAYDRAVHVYENGI